MKHYLYQGTGYARYQGKAQAPDLMLLKSMIRLREVELRIAARYGEDEMKTPIHLMVGQEASAVGAAAAMRREDRVYLSHRTHGHYLAKGGDLSRMVLELYGRAEGCSGSRGGSMHLIDKSMGVDGASAIVAGVVPLAAGAALAAQRLRQRHLTTVYFGDAAMEEGALSETLNLAALWKLPMLFFCENNFYSVCTPLDQRQPNVSLPEKARAFGVHAVEVDGNDVYAVRAAVTQARERALSGQGPCFIEAKVYRWLAHVGSNDDTSTGYRSQEELAQWKDHCPIALLENFLLSEGVANGPQLQAWREEAQAEIQGAMEMARRAPFPDPKSLLTHVYAPAEKIP